MIGVCILEEAEEEMEYAALYFAAEADGLGALFADDIQEALASIRMYPQLGSVIVGPYRRKLLSRFPFSIIYVAESEAITIVAVAHHRRRPDYWQNRIRP